LIRLEGAKNSACQGRLLALPTKLSALRIVPIAGFFTQSCGWFFVILSIFKYTGICRIKNKVNQGIKGQSKRWLYIPPFDLAAFLQAEALNSGWTARATSNPWNA